MLFLPGGRYFLILYHIQINLSILLIAIAFEMYLDNSMQILYNNLNTKIGGTMKSTIMRFIACLLALITLLSSFAACADTGDRDDVTTEPLSTEAPVQEETTAEETEPKVYLTINPANAASVTIVRSDSVPKLSTMLDLFTAFRKEMNNRFGATFGIGTDFVAPGKSVDDKIEILVGDTIRDASAELKTKLNALGSHGFGIIVRGNKIAVNGTTFYLLYQGLDYLLENFVTKDDAGNISLVLEEDFECFVKTEEGYISPEEVMASGREMAFYPIETLANVPEAQGCAVMQGGGSDGKYAYYAMINKSTTPETGMIYKYDVNTWELVAKSKPMPSGHTNDITYDSKNHRLVISFCSASDGYKGLVFVNPDTLEFIEYIVCPTSNRGVCYLPETNQYLFATGYTFHLTDENFNTIKSTTDGYAKLTTQGFYCDGKYIFDPRWQSGARFQTITINTLEGEFIAAVPLYNIDGEPENIFRDGNSFVMGCNKSDSVFRLVLLYKNWWE